MLKFVFNNRNSYDDMDCIVVGQIDYPITQEEYESIEVVGRRQGSLTKKTNNFSDKILKMNLRLVKVDDFETRKKEILKWLLSIEDRKLYIEDNPTKSYVVKYVKITKFTPKSGTQVEFSIEFNCEPFLVDTLEYEIDIKNGDIVYNFGDEESDPIIFINSPSTQNIQLTIKEKTLVIYNANGEITIDCQRFLAYGPESVFKTSGNFPTLPIGESKIEWVGNLSNVSIIQNTLYRG